MQHGRSFSWAVERLRDHERKAPRYRDHPGTEALLDGLMDELSPSARCGVVAHVLTCSECRARRNELAHLLEYEAKSLESKAGVRSFSEVVRRRNANSVRRKWIRRTLRWLSMLVHLHRARPIAALATTAIMTAMLAVAVLVPLLHQRAMPEDDPSPSIPTIPEFIERLPLLLAASDAADTEEHALDALLEPPGVLAEENRSMVSPWKQSRQMDRELGDYGIGIPSELDFSQLQPYVVEEGDTWASIARDTLGDAAYWPLIWLLNSETEEFEFAPQPGRRLMLPALAD